MQQLIFEEAWNKTISLKDRHELETLFQQTKNTASEGIFFSIVRIAVNHRNDLLVTALVHNFNHQAHKLTEETILLLEKSHVLSRLTITDSRLQLSAKTSMPWTFIFSDIDQPQQIKQTSLTLSLSN
ncbi:SLAP domain-containing protein [Gracilibacillus alcaliphilus]|uniref:SLAP domain-containing protein n=1 Tax=Gracilibacillus alcaliphilus TaxID=1401441 RepID=UPI0019564783|nr:SLAP domain-containing protein [Gracilibacillus alcaliphilus]MBM7678512.1 SLAP domain-containing protein [Gracilibacillus alcaliphilus]